MPNRHKYANTFSFAKWVNLFNPSGLTPYQQCYWFFCNLTIHSNMSYVLWVKRKKGNVIFRLMIKSIFYSYFLYKFTMNSQQMLIIKIINFNFNLKTIQIHNVLSLICNFFYLREMNKKCVKLIKRNTERIKWDTMQCLICCEPKRVNN